MARAKESIFVVSGMFRRSISRFTMSATVVSVTLSAVFTTELARAFSVSGWAAIESAAAVITFFTVSATTSAVSLPMAGTVSVGGTLCLPPSCT